MRKKLKARSELRGSSRGLKVRKATMPSLPCGAALAERVNRIRLMTWVTVVDRTGSHPKTGLLISRLVDFGAAWQSIGHLPS